MLTGMRLPRKNRWMLLGVAVALLWSFFQLFNVIAYGEIFTGPYANIRWITYAESPGWFVTGIVVYVLVALFCAVGLVGNLIWPDGQ